MVKIKQILILATIITTTTLPIIDIYDIKEEPTPYSFFGYTALGAYGDSRQVIGEQDDYSLISPEPKECDCNGRDKNAHGQFNMLAIETNLGMKFTGPHLNDESEISGVIWGQFYGTTDFTLNVFRLIHGYALIEWPEYRYFLAGNYWHPMFVPDCYPHTIAYNNGAPVEVQLWNPQLRFSQRIENYELLMVAISQANFLSPGPRGYNSIYMRNAIVPNMHLQVRRYSDRLLLGASIDYKRLVPRLVNTFDCIVDESINSVLLMFYGSYKITPNATFSSKIIWGGNGDDLSLISGYAVETITPDDHRTYANTNAFAWWIDTEIKCNEFTPGLFLGFTQNLGSSKPLFINPLTQEPITYEIMPHLDYLFRISPRLVWEREALRLAVEFETTHSSFGCLNNFSRVTNGTGVTNFRLLFASYYLF